MKTLPKEKVNLGKEAKLFFEDVSRNITATKVDGITTIHVEEEYCGSDEDYFVINDPLTEMEMDSDMNTIAGIVCHFVHKPEWFPVDREDFIAAFIVRLPMGYNYINAFVSKGWLYAQTTELHELEDSDEEVRKLARTQIPRDLYNEYLKRTQHIELI